MVAALPVTVNGPSASEGIVTRLPHAEGARALTSLACLRAAHPLRGDPHGGSRRGHRRRFDPGPARRGDGYLVSILVRYAIEERMGRTLAIHLPNLNSEMLRELEDATRCLAPGGSTAAAVRDEEKSGLDWLVAFGQGSGTRVKDREKTGTKCSSHSRGGGRPRIHPEVWWHHGRRSQVRGGDAAVVCADGGEVGSATGPV